MSECGFSPSFSPGSQAGGDAINRHRSAFPDPWLDYSSTQMPRSIYDVLRWSEHVYLNDGTYRTAVQRVVRYFLTKIELKEASEDEKDKYQEFLVDDLKIMNVLALAGDDFMIYGNAFLYLFASFRRYLRCPKCKLERPCKRMQWSFRVEDKKGKFFSKCENKNCGFKGEFVRVDRATFDQDKIKIGRISPHRMRIVPQPVSMSTRYYWDLDPWLRKEIKQGSRLYLEEMPWEVVETVIKDELLRFNEDAIFHLKEEAPSGVWVGGWGIPRMFSSFKQAWFNQIMKRYCEAFALDYVIPFRTLTPKAGNTREGDPLLNLNLSTFQSQVMSMFQQHRRDPTTLHALPFPVDLEMLGAGAGQELMPVELLKWGTAELLNGLGVPVEFYEGTISDIKVLPAVLRLFEMTWSGLVTGLNDLLGWVCKRASQMNNWERLSATLQSPTIAYDIERKQLLLQLSAGQQISRQTAWAPWGLEVREEIKRLLQEEGVIQEEMTQFQEEQAQKQELQRTMAMGAAGMLQPVQPGAPGQPGAPAAGAMGGAPGAPGAAPGAPQGGGAPVPGMAPGMPPMGTPPAMSPTEMTPQDLQAQAASQATQALGMPYEMRRSFLNDIKKSNETLHALVIAKMNEMRQRAKNVGGQQVIQQMTQPQA